MLLNNIRNKQYNREADRKIMIKVSDGWMADFTIKMMNHPAGWSSH